ncbi:MAG: lipopolysaccharide biosynthesis protein [Fibrobacter sp.]|nr:lipopolysaccharide biosynthesis protein [Fibrobacter sp.]
MSITNNKTIAKNTIFLYVRMFVSMVISLYTSRIVLQTIGVVDFGIYNIVGGVVSMLIFLKNSMAISVQRFLNFELGKNNIENLKKIFSISLMVHCVIALLVFIVAETIGQWFLYTRLNIPYDRLGAANWVYHFSVISCMFSIIQVPYIAVIVSREKLNIYAYISIVDVILKLLIVYLLVNSSIDKLVLYAMLTTSVAFIGMMITILYCLKTFSEAHFHFCADIKIVREITTFAGWSMLGEIAWVCTLQGVNIILNIFYGPIVNAARSISFQVNTNIYLLVSNFQTALNPQIIKNFATGNIVAMENLIVKGTKFSYYLLLLISLPILIETEFVLQMWLNYVPAYTVIFCRIVLINSLIDVLGNTYATAARAYGKIMRYQIIVSSVLVMNLPLSYIMLKIGKTPEYTLYIYGFIAIVLVFVRLFLLNKMIGLSLILFIKSVLLSVTIVTLSSMIFPMLVYIVMPTGLFRFIITVIISFFSVGFSTYYFGMNRSDRKLVVEKIKYFFNRRKIVNGRNL